MVDDVVLEEGRVVCDFDASSQAGHLFVEWCLFKRDLSLMSFAVVDGLSEEKEDGRAEVLPL